MPSIDRNIRKSVMAFVRGFFQAPPAWTGLTPYIVYNETNLRSYQESGTRPTSGSPFVFLLDSYIRPAEPLLPEVIVEINTITDRPFELGNRNGREPDVLVHFFGRSRGERDDLSSYFKDHLKNTGYIPIYTYTSSSSTLLENALVSAEIVCEQVAQRSDELRQEGSLDLWAMVSFGLSVRN